MPARNHPRTVVLSAFWLSSLLWAAHAAASHSATSHSATSHSAASDRASVQRPQAAASDARHSPDSNAHRSAPPEATSLLSRDKARKLARKALELMHAERWAEASSLLAQAYALVPAPTIALLEARAFDKQDKLLDACERYRAAKSYPLSSNSPKAFRKAVKQASLEYKELKPQLPKLLLTLSGDVPRSGSVRLRLNGKPFPQAKLGVAQPLDPGNYVISADRGETLLARQEISLARNQTKQLVLVLPPSHPAPKPSPELAQTASETQSDGPKVLAWSSIALGGVGVTTGVVAGIIMLDAKSDLDAGCTDGCAAGLSPTLSRFRTARTVSAVGYSVGALGLGLGTILLLYDLSPKESARASARDLKIWASPSQLGVSGAF